MQGKKSFVLYSDLVHTVRKMDKKDAGELFLTILEYVNDEDPKPENQLVDLVFEPIKQQLKRDLNDWKSRIQKRSEAGKASAKKRAQQNQQVLTSVNKPEQRSTNSTVNVNDNVNVSVNVNDNVNVNVKDTKQEREVAFKKQVFKYSHLYSEKMLQDFFLYWTESKPKGRKLRYEMQKVFDLSRRLTIWSNRENYSQKRDINTEKTRNEHESSL